MSFKPLWGIVLWGIVLWAIAPPTQAQSSLDRQAKEVAARLIGVMDTSAQAAANPDRFDVRMTTCAINIEGRSSPDAIYLYQEQALSSELAKPYRQRFLQISPSVYSQTVLSLSFRPARPEKFIGLCNQPEASRIVLARDLGQPICTVFLKQSGDDFAGRTPIDGCAANVRGAVRITNQVTLYKSGMETWDRGYDARGKQVWGAKTESYQYRRRK
ncbi:MAG: chorismate mutase [Leptolyngbyaceae cyanobacterium CSU_1_3]|nr:chorismate mutase [Leptolyngbyaceae cyanobacterium CSU_1_3]